MPTKRCGGTDCCYLDNENYRIKYGTYKNTSTMSKNSKDITMYRKECLNPNERCGKYLKLDQNNSSSCMGPIYL